MLAARITSKSSLSPSPFRRSSSTTAKLPLRSRGQKFDGDTVIRPVRHPEGEVSLQQTGNESHRPWGLGRHTAPCERQMNEVQLLVQDRLGETHLEMVSIDRQIGRGQGKLDTFRR